MSPNAVRNVRRLLSAGATVLVLMGAALAGASQGGVAGILHRAREAVTDEPPEVRDPSEQVDGEIGDVPLPSSRVVGRGRAGGHPKAERSRAGGNRDNEHSQAGGHRDNEHSQAGGYRDNEHSQAWGHRDGERPLAGARSDEPPHDRGPARD